MAHEFIYTCYKLARVYPPDRTVLENISLSFYPGAKIGVIGGNGAGKSSLLKIMAGLDDGYSGEAMAGECVPLKGRFIGAPMTKRVDAHGGVKVSYAHAIKKPSEIVGGVEVFKPDRFTAYA